VPALPPPHEKLSIGHDHRESREQWTHVTVDSQRRTCSSQQSATYRPPNRAKLSPTDADSYGCAAGARGMGSETRQSRLGRSISVLEADFPLALLGPCKYTFLSSSGPRGVHRFLDKKEGRREWKAWLVCIVTVP
jgi:hypothetical protein